MKMLRPSPGFESSPSGIFRFVKVFPTSMIMAMCFWKFPTSMHDA